MRGKKLSALVSVPLRRSAYITSVGGPRQGAMDGDSRPALPGLHDVLCRLRSSGSLGLRVAVVEPSVRLWGPRYLNPKSM